MRKHPSIAPISVNLRIVSLASLGYRGPWTSNRCLKSAARTGRFCGGFCQVGGRRRRGGAGPCDERAALMGRRRDCGYW